MTRDAIIIGIACLIAIVVGAWFFFADSGAPRGAIGEDAMRVIGEGQHSGEITERKNYRITTFEELQQLWRMVYGNQAPPLPVVNFAKSEVLAVFDGTHSSGGYDISILSIEDEAGAARSITVLHTEPGADCVTTAAITSPFVIVALPKTELPIVRTDITETASCE